MLKAFILTTLCVVAFADDKHPVNDEVVTSIKEKTTMWKPIDTQENTLKDVPQ